MNNFAVTTGYGYYKDLGGNIVDKAELPKGSHPLKAGYTYVEVVSKTVLDAIEVYEPPETQQQQYEKLIAAEIRKPAVDKLKTEGKLPQDYQ